MAQAELMGESPKRRLPVVQSQGDPADDDRPRWQWCALGVAFTALVWIPLSAISNAAIRKFMIDDGGLSSAPMFIGVNATIFLFCFAAGGFFVGRLSPHAKTPDFGLTGLTTSVLAGIASFMSLDASPGHLFTVLTMGLLAGLGFGAAHFGGLAGRRRRQRRT